MSDEELQKSSIYQYKLGFSQSLTSGIVAVHGDVHFDTDEQAKEVIDTLLKNANYMVAEFKKNGFQVAKEITINKNGTTKRPNA